MEQENKKKRFWTIVKSLPSKLIYDKNSDASVLSYIFLISLILLTARSKYTFIFISGIISIIFSFFTGLGLILRKKYDNISTSKVNLLIYVLFIVTLVPQLNIINPNSASLPFILIAISYSLQNILYSIFIFLWKNNAKKTYAVKRYDAIYLSIFTIVIALFIFSFWDFLFFKISLLFFVYGLSSLIREKYLIESIKSDLGAGVTFKRSVFSNVASMNNLTPIFLFLMFLLFYSNVFAIDSQSILYFYSTTAQVFAALLGIIVMFSILILQKGYDQHGGRKTVLKKGLVGFTILYILIIMSSTMGTVLNNLDYINSLKKLPGNIADVDLKCLLGVSIFEFVILMIPMGLLYLYAMISDFLKWEATFETKLGQGLDTRLLKAADGADTFVFRSTDD